MGNMVYSLLWVMLDFVHQQYHRRLLNDKLSSLVTSFATSIIMIMTITNNRYKHLPVPRSCEFCLWHFMAMSPAVAAEKRRSISSQGSRQH